MKKNKIQVIISNVENTGISDGAIGFHVMMKNSIDSAWPSLDDPTGWLKSEIEAKIEEYRQFVFELAKCDDVEVIIK